jgi:hypothetical protein
MMIYGWRSSKYLSKNEGFSHKNKSREGEKKNPPQK